MQYYIILYYIILIILSYIIIILYDYTIVNVAHTGPLCNVVYCIYILLHTPSLFMAKSKKDQDLIKVLMGDEVGPRKNFIINRALEVSNLDI